MQERTKRILDTAMELAAEGGFEAVRLRDVAANAGVALGTLYRHFRSKEDLLMAALSREVQGLVERMKKNPPQGETPLERVTAYFSAATRAMCRKPNFARAVLRSAASGVPELTEKIAQFDDVLEGMIVAALQGSPPCSLQPTQEESNIAEILQDVWFAGLIGWMGGQHAQSAVVEHVGKAAELMLRNSPPKPAEGA
jgi:AcrR family transcriptional regulator